MTGSELHQTYSGAIGCREASAAPVVSDAPTPLFLKRPVCTSKILLEHGRFGLRPAHPSGAKDLQQKHAREMEREARHR